MASTPIHRSHTDRSLTEAFVENNEKLVELIDYESDPVQRMLIGKNGKGNKKDPYADLPFFKDITNERDRRLLKEALVDETFKPGQIIFNYGKL